MEKPGRDPGASVPAGYPQRPMSQADTLGMLKHRHGSVQERVLHRHRKDFSFFFQATRCLWRVWGRGRGGLSSSGPGWLWGLRFTPEKWAPLLPNSRPQSVCRPHTGGSGEVLHTGDRRHAHARTRLFRSRRRKREQLRCLQGGESWDIVPHRKRTATPTGSGRSQTLM